MKTIGDNPSLEVTEIIDSNFDEIYDNSILPHHPDINKVDELCQYLIKGAIS
jgi:hypothetical protein